ncbi:MAG: hypothetical protein ACFFDE_06940 [Promethearchaeota archaeon]
MKVKKRSSGIGKKIRGRRKNESRIGFAIIAIILAILVIISVLAVNSIVNQWLEDQAASVDSEPKAAIVDQLSLTYGNQAFIENATATLEKAGYGVDYYSSNSVTVEFYRNLPRRQYNILILRTHSAAVAVDETGLLETPVFLFTCEHYSTTRYVWEQLNDRIVAGMLDTPQTSHYFGVTPKFVASSMNGRFRGTTVIMMGCEGLDNVEMAEAFVQKGAKAYVGWIGSVSAYHTDMATTHLLQHLLIENRTLGQAVDATMENVGPDPEYNAFLEYYPLESGSQIIRNIMNTWGVVIGDFPMCALCQFQKSHKGSFDSAKTGVAHGL